MIAVWGVLQDRPIAAVLDQLRRSGHSFGFIDQLAPAAGQDAASWALQVNDGVISGFWSSDGYKVDLAHVTALYARPYDTAALCRALELDPRGAQAADLAEREQALAAWWAAFDGLSVNPPGAMVLNGSKPLQLIAVAAGGFAVPQTGAGNDPNAATRFLAAHDEVIYKSVSAVRSAVTVLDTAKTARLGDLPYCPTQLQRRVPGRDVRVHVVGQEVYATAITTDAVDYRYPRGAREPDLTTTELPEEIASQCVRLAADMGLAFAGIDLREGTDGLWYCFEVNPSPGFTYYESRTGQPIAQALARLLARP